MKKGQGGGAVIAFIIIATVAAGAYIIRTTDLVKRGAERTSQVRINHQVDSIGKGFLNYTIYAIKERWCMDESWGRDTRCGDGDMQAFLFHPRNLERLLWSNVAIDGIRERFIAKYTAPPTQSIGLSNISTAISIDKLADLGDAHPLNLILPKNVKGCFSHVSINIKKPNNATSYLQGDEVALHISTKFHHNGTSSTICNRIGSDIATEGFVVFFPRTLNQFGLIKSGDFDLSTIKGPKNSGGVHFWGDTYIQGDILIPRNGKAPVDFKGQVRLGNGIIRQGTEKYKVPADGTIQTKLQSGYTTFGGFLGGVGLDGEPDDGLSKLFDGSFSYPSNSLLGKCLPRLKVKNSPAETRNARLFAKGSGTSYTLALSSEDEFREYSYFGDGKTNYFVRAIEEDTHGIKVNYTSRSLDEKPIMKVDISAGSAVGTSLLIGRNTSVELDLFDREKFITDNKIDMSDSTNELTKELESNPAPRLILKFSTDRANRVEFNYILENSDSLKSDIYESLRKIDLKFVAFDFAIEGSNNPITGRRSARSHFPGPNDEHATNIMTIKTTVARTDPKPDSPKYIRSIKTLDSRGDEISSWQGATTTDGWAPLKQGESDPPYNLSMGSRKFIIPEYGISLASSKELDELCDFDATAKVAPQWDISFTENTKFSWLYNVTAPGISIADPSNVKPVDEYIFTSASMEPGTYQGVPTFSMAKRCIVPSNISLVFGMYVCEQLVIKDRRDPLTFIGTYIVNDISFSSSSVSRGVNFYSLWNSKAIDILQKRGDLVRKNKPAGSNACIFDQPGWSPNLDEATLEDFQNCSPMKFIYYGANNFNWTTVDPEIGLPPSGSHNQTMSKVPNRYRRYTATVVWVK